MVVTITKIKIMLSYLVDGQAQENMASHKVLRLVLNNKFTWSDHGVSTGTNKRLNILAHLKHVINRETLHIMYELFIHPSLEYGNIYSVIVHN